MDDQEKTNAMYNQRIFVKISLILISIKHPILM